MIRLLARLALLAALITASRATQFEDGSIQFFDRPGLGFCLPGGICNEGTP